MKQEQDWQPLQSNPEVMNQLLQQLGFNTERFQVQDVLSVQQWAQEMIPVPVLGIVFLYQLSQPQKKYQQAQKLQQKQQKSVQNVFFMKQYAQNACGTIALFHVVLNSIYDYPDLVSQGSYFAKFMQDSFGKSPAQIGQNFKQNKSIMVKHKQSVKKGVSKISSKVSTHFIAFIQKNGFIYELDGRRKQPLCHGQCNPQGLTFMACINIKQIMQRDPDNTKYAILAIAPKPYFD